jgi:hypothetical protein
MVDFRSKNKVTMQQIISVDPNQLSRKICLNTTLSSLLGLVVANSVNKRCKAVGLLVGASTSLGSSWGELKAIGSKVTGLDKRFEYKFTSELRQLELELRLSQ